MAVKRLLRQTLSHDDEMIEVHSLAELILSEGVRLAAGSSIKTDGEDSDPWALVGVVDIAKHRVGLMPLTKHTRVRYLSNRIRRIQPSHHSWNTCSKPYRRATQFECY
jgi:hypothetical protein